MRKTVFAPGEYYHIFNRGNNKQTIFKDSRDYIRFVFLILYLQSPRSVHNIGEMVSGYIKKGRFPLESHITDEILNTRFVDLISFALMPNHFHLCLKERVENGISLYLHKISTGYAKYFTIKYDFKGHLFQGPFKAVHVGSNEQLAYLSAYIHRNPRELRQWYNREDKYPWSSYQDYIHENRWSTLLQNEIIIEQFKNSKSYKIMVESSGAKDLEFEYEISPQLSNA